MLHLLVRLVALTCNVLVPETQAGELSKSDFEICENSFSGNGNHFSRTTVECKNVMAFIYFGKLEAFISNPAHKLQQLISEAILRTTHACYYSWGSES